MRTIAKFTLLAALPLALAVPAAAQTAAPAPDAKMPTCSAKVTDNCMQREGHAKAMTGHKMAKHRWHHRKHHGKHHAAKAVAAAAPKAK